MNEIIGIFIILSSIVFGCIAILAMDFEFKEKAKLAIGFEIFLGLILIGAYIFTGGK